MTASVQFPVRIASGGRGGTVGSAGWLVIEPGAVSWEFDQRRFYRIAQRIATNAPPPAAVVHAELPITILRSRLAPPGMNRMLILSGAEATVAVEGWFGRWPRIRAALRAAEIPVVERVVLLSLGAREVREGNPPSRTPASP